jgi:hypothetical protein
MRNSSKAVEFSLHVIRYRKCLTYLYCSFHLLSTLCFFHRISTLPIGRIWWFSLWTVLTITVFWDVIPYRLVDKYQNVSEEHVASIFRVDYHCYPPTKLHGNTSQETVIFVILTVGTSNLWICIQQAYMYNVMWVRHRTFENVLRKPVAHVRF